MISTCQLGIQPYMVGGPPSHCAIQIEVGGDSSFHEVHREQPQSPHQQTLIRSRGCAVSDGKLHCLAAIGLHCYIATAFTDSDHTTAIAKDGSSSSSAKPSDSQRPLPLSFLLHLDLVVHVLGFVHHVLVKLYPLDLCLVDYTVLTMVSDRFSVGFSIADSTPIGRSPAD